MVNYDELPLFPLHIVLYPDMPLPLHIFEPRYRLMIRRCREQNSAFGIALIQSGQENAQKALPHCVGTTARITQFEELADGRINIVVAGQTRFRISRIQYNQPYPTGKVTRFWEQEARSEDLAPYTDAATTIFKAYLRSLCALTGRSLSALQLPHDPEYLSYAIASVLQIPLSEKQRLLEASSTEARLRREIEILRQEVDAQSSLRAVHRSIGAGPGSTITRVDTQSLSRFSSLN